MNGRPRMTAAELFLLREKPVRIMTITVVISEPIVKGYCLPFFKANCQTGLPDKIQNFDSSEISCFEIRGREGER